MIFYQKILAMQLYDAIHGLITVYAYLIDWILCEYSAVFEFGRVPPPLPPFRNGEADKHQRRIFCTAE